MYQFDWSILWGEGGRLLAEGAVVTLKLAALSLVLAVVLGFLFGVMRWSSVPVLRPICWIYVEFLRNTPPLVQILFWYFSATVILPAGAIAVLRDYGFQFVAAVFALALYHSGFVAEIVRGGLNAIPRGQHDAAEALGFGFVQSVRYVLLPQLLRIIAPSLVNESVSLIKNTSLALAIGVADITYQARYIDYASFRGVEALTAVTVFYLVVCTSISAFGHFLQHRLSRPAGCSMNWQLVFTTDNIRRALIGDWPASLGGVALTVELSLIGMVLATLLGFLVGYLRFAGTRPVRWLAGGYVELLRNVPLLVLVFWAYFAPPYFGFRPTKFSSVLLAIVLFNAAYIAEVVRGGLLSVPAGQVEAARAMGMSSWQLALYVQIPIATYNSIPAMTGRYITLLKGTSLAFLIGLSEVTEIGRQINNRLLTAPVEVYALLLAIYFCLNRLLSAGMRLLEDRRRFNRLICFFAR